MFQREESVIVIVIVNLFDCDFYCAGKEPEEKCTADSDCKTGEECKNGVCTTKTTTKTNTTTIIIIIVIIVLIIGGIVFFYLVKTGKIKLPGGKKKSTFDAFKKEFEFKQTFPTKPSTQQSTKPATRPFTKPTTKSKEEMELDKSIKEAEEWLIIFFIIIFSNIILADDINIFIERTEYKQYETIIFKIFSNVDLSDEIELSQLGVYDIYNDKRSSSIVLTEINKKEYMGYIDTAYLNKGEYYFAINSVEYFKDSKLKRSNFQINFNINDNKEDVISIYPGIFYKKIDLWENPWIDFKFENKGNSINRKYIQGEFIILNYHIPILF